MKLYTLLLVFCLSLLQVAGQENDSPYMLVLGNAQDGGYPHMGCSRECCRLAWDNPSMRRMVVSLALVDPPSGKWYLFEATPDIKEQLQLFRETTGGQYNYLPDAIFVSHAHIGHYTGLMEFGREVMSTSHLTVYVLPRMKSFLESNGPWSQLVDLGNIEPVQVVPGGQVALSESIAVNIFTVPHRDEFSETAGYRIDAGNMDYLLIPDIDKWNRWDQDIRKMVRSSDIAFLDGTFFDGDELPGRNMSEVPHPFVIETMELFSKEPESERTKVHFIHMNHTNPLLWNDGNVSLIKNNHFSIAEQGQKY